MLSINGTRGYVYEGRIATIDSSENPLLRSFMALADKHRRLGVRANADTPEDARVARSFGAEGIGLFRTEHMFYGKNSEKPLFALRKMILSNTREERVKALAELFVFVKSDIKNTLKAMEGLPVTFRLLDPPLHEFVPNAPEARAELASSLGITVEEIAKRAEGLHEVNPMMGHRGVRLGITYPEVSEMQMRAILEAACELENEGTDCKPEIMPMQELLASLKERWGCLGVLPYPALNSPAARPEILYAGNRLFRNRFFIDFEPMLELRRELNAKYVTLMEGPATVAGMLIWGLAQHRFFRNCKMLFPVDAEPKSGNPAERELSLVFIRAGEYFDLKNPLNGFLNFQREFNQRLWRTRKGESESYELLELYSMIHPVFYQIGLRLMPDSMSEFVGSMGLSILRNADIFISPLSDLQVNGFMLILNAFQSRFLRRQPDFARIGKLLMAGIMGFFTFLMLFAFGLSWYGAQFGPPPSWMVSAVFLGTNLILLFLLYHYTPRMIFPFLMF